MISFCQDLSISHEYHIYENKTIKKVIHKRDGSNISERTFTKASKLEVVSKRFNTKNHQSISDAKVSDSQRKLPSHRPQRLNHQRSISNNLQFSTDLHKSNQTLIIENPTQTNNYFEFRQVNSVQIPADIHQLRSQNIQNNIQSIQRLYKKEHISAKIDPIQASNNIELRQVNSFQIHAAIHQRRAQNMQPFDFKNPKQEKKELNFFKTPPIIKPIPGYQTQSKLLKESQFAQINHTNSQKSQQKTVKFGSSIVKLNESVETKRNSLNSERDFLSGNHSKTNSCSVNQNFTNKIVTYSFIQDQDCESKGLDKYDTIITQNSSQNSPFKDIGIKKYSGFGDFSHRQLVINKIPEFTQKTRFNQHLRYEGAEQLVFKQSYFQQKTRFQKTDNLFDAASIKSYSLKSYQADEQQDSVVEHRSFFFQKEQQPLKMFKKSIEKYLFLQPGHMSSCQRWVIFKKVQQKDTRKPYSIKEFSIQNQNIYLDQYQAYLALKVQKHNGQKEPKRSTSFILELYNALSNNDDEMLHLVKQPFKCILNDHIREIIRKTAFSVDRKQQVNVERSKILEQIDRIMLFFSRKQLSMKKQQNFQIEDFVVCQNLQNGSAIKFHSLHKLQPIQQNHTNELLASSLQQKINLSTNYGRKMDLFQSKSDKQAIQRIQREKKQDLLIKIEHAFENM